ncbi:MAG: hypothetical protein E7004_00550 [Alphaproteobacteria bacterium]|nr:hypothetical protein [Alphaproteobacteria bacterium]
MPENIIEDSKVIGSASIAVLLDYAQIFNQLITLMISVCTLVYVANRAYYSLFIHKKKKRKGKRK